MIPRFKIGISGRHKHDFIQVKGSKGGLSHLQMSVVDRVKGPSKHTFLHQNVIFLSLSCAAGRYRTTLFPMICTSWEWVRSESVCASSL